MKYCSNGMSYMTLMAAIPVYGTTFNYLFLQNQKTDSLEALYIAVGTWVIQDEHLWPLVGLDLFYSKVKFVLWCFYRGKCWNIRFHGNCWRWPKKFLYTVILMRTKRYMNARGKVIFLPSTQVSYWDSFKQLLKSHLANCNQGFRKWNFFHGPSHMTSMAAIPICGKNL